MYVYPGLSNPILGPHYRCDWNHQGQRNDPALRDSRRLRHFVALCDEIHCLTKDPIPPRIDTGRDKYVMSRIQFIFIRALYMSLSELFSLYLQYFFILTPFFVLAIFLAVTDGASTKARANLAVRTGLGVTGVSVLLFLFGPSIFKVFGITLDAFRIGSGTLLLLTAISLVDGKIQPPSKEGSLNDLAVVPLAIPITVGPGAMGTLIVLSLENRALSDVVFISVALALASISVGLMLYWARSIDKWIGRGGIAMLSKLTGLVLACLSCQMIFTGIAAFLKP